MYTELQSREHAWDGTMLRNRTTACRCIRTRLCKYPSSHRLHWHSCLRTAHYQPSCRRHTANRKSFARRLCPHSPNHPPWSNSQRYNRHRPWCSRRRTPRPKPGAAQLRKQKFSAQAQIAGQFFSPQIFVSSCLGHIGPTSLHRFHVLLYKMTISEGIRVIV